MTSSLTIPVDPRSPALRALIDAWRGLPLSIAALSLAARPRVVFLPAGPRSDGAVRLRIHAVAEGLGEQGWDARVMPCRLSLRARQKWLRQLAPELVIMQGARHPLNRPEYYPGAPILYDMDDADFHLPHLEAPVRAAMTQVAGVIAGSDYIARWCRAAGAPLTEVVWTGAPASRRAPLPQTARAPVVAWAQTCPTTYAAEADLVVQVMARVARARGGAVLRLWDRGAGEAAAEARLLARLEDAGVSVDWRGHLSYPAYLASLDDVAIGLAPLSPASAFSRGKSFGKVLAYLDRGVPVIASSLAEHPRFFTADTGVLAETAEDWSSAILRLLPDAALRQSMAEAARVVFLDRLTDRAAARGVAAVLQGARRD